MATCRCRKCSHVFPSLLNKLLSLTVDWVAMWLKWEKAAGCSGAVPSIGGSATREGGVTALGVKSLFASAGGCKSASISERKHTHSHYPWTRRRIEPFLLPLCYFGFLLNLHLWNKCFCERPGQNAMKLPTEIYISAFSDVKDMNRLVDAACVYFGLYSSIFRPS